MKYCALMIKKRNEGRVRKERIEKPEEDTIPINRVTVKFHLHLHTATCLPPSPRHTLCQEIVSDQNSRGLRWSRYPKHHQSVQSQASTGGGKATDREEEEEEEEELEKEEKEEYEEELEEEEDEEELEEEEEKEEEEKEEEEKEKEEEEKEEKEEEEEEEENEEESLISAPLPATPSTTYHYPWPPPSSPSPPPSTPPFPFHLLTLICNHTLIQATPHHTTQHTITNIQFLHITNHHIPPERQLCHTIARLMTSYIDAEHNTADHHSANRRILNSRPPHAHTPDYPTLHSPQHAPNTIPQHPHAHSSPVILT
ncbi:hypothetical protein Pmani_016374 [Petrolisthes manimaculis]|uniref:Uncharacterized protein n=1 Tax=Petrolisthes manimaculis TaxID=1843537 RepID=A0AAE1PRS1_9EUCA|nr:hypothetical protein Pmani_016374 [Petrolisthes manimaculis]